MRAVNYGGCVACFCFCVQENPVHEHTHTHTYTHIHTHNREISFMSSRIAPAIPLVTDGEEEGEEELLATEALIEQIEAIANINIVNKAAEAAAKKAEEEAATAAEKAAPEGGEVDMCEEVATCERGDIVSMFEKVSMFGKGLSISPLSPAVAESVKDVQRFEHDTVAQEGARALSISLEESGDDVQMLEHHTSAQEGQMLEHDVMLDEVDASTEESARALEREAIPAESGDDVQMLEQDLKDTKDLEGAGARAREAKTVLSTTSAASDSLAPTPQKTAESQVARTPCMYVCMHINFIIYFLNSISSSNLLFFFLNH